MLELFYILTTSIAIMISTTISGATPSQESLLPLPKKSAKCFDVETLGPASPSLFVVNAQGRLGNHLMAYAIVHALAFKLDIVPLITR